VADVSEQIHLQVLEVLDMVINEGNISIDDLAVEFGFSVSQTEIVRKLIKERKLNFNTTMYCANQLFNGVTVKVEFS
jgi:hypothetical protein